MPQRSMIDWPGCSRLRRVWHLRSGLRPSLRRHTRINHHPILSLTLVLKSGGPHDNGPEFIARELQRWLERASVRTLYIQKASPWENGYVESFNGKLRDELLNREL